jgi:hypothetical protein
MISYEPSVGKLGGRGTMRKSTSTVKKLIAQAERKLAHLELMEKCVCAKNGYAVSLEPESFEKEMNRPCPAHETRSLGGFFVIYVQPEGPEQEATNAKFEELLAEYQQRSHRLVSSGLAL